MITSLRLKNFKNFADETLRLGPFTVIVGANASGKSNIRDAFRFLHGIGRGYTLAEIVGGKYGAGGQLESVPMRGATNEIIRIRKSTSVPPPPLPSFAFEIALTTVADTAGYSIEVSREMDKSGFRITYERLQIAGETVFEKPRNKYGNRQVDLGANRAIDIDLDRPALVQVLESLEVSHSERERLRLVVDVLASMRFPEFSPDRMREPAFSSQTMLGDWGGNLPTVLKEICANHERKSTLIEWIRELTPMDVEDFDFPADPSGRIHLKIRESGRDISAYSASDGTLRFLAVLAALLGRDPTRLYFLEEIDIGLHPSRLHLLVELIERQTAKGGPQVIATTHSPDLLSMVSDETFENTSVTCRLEHTNDAIIRPVADLPNAGKLRKTQGLGRLLAGGWMEDALAFTESSGEDDKE